MFGLGFGARRRGLRRFVDGGDREVNRPLRLIAVSTAALLTVTLAPAEAIAGRGDPARTDVELPELQKDQPVPGADSTDTFQLPVAPGTQIEYAPTRITPIDGGTDQIVLGGGGAQAQSRTATGSQAAAGSEMQQVASLPLWVGASQTSAPATQSGAQARTATAANTTSASGTWTVTVPTRAETEAAGIDGVIMKLEPSPDATPVDLKLKYETFEQLYGAGWGSRLRFVQFPECFLTTPEVEGCSDAVDVASANNGTTNEVTATIAAPEAPAGTLAARASGVTTASTGGAVVLAATGGAAGDSGNYGASPLQPSGTWSAGDASGGFSWSYPVNLPPVGIGPKPNVSLDYASQNVDGRTSTTNNQASWIGDGWDYQPGFIERAYRGCVDDKVGSNTTRKDIGDLCWGGYNAVMSLNGATTQLVPTWASDQARANGDAPVKWTPITDNGTRVQLATGATNGDDNGEHWIVTTPDGTRYHFGLNRLPGWTTGKPTTDSTWTVPVFGNQANEPCHQSAYENSACDQAWRWNLDYVEDVHGNAMAAYWKQEKNWYAKAGKFDQSKPYVRGGWPDRIEYGLRADSVYTRPAPAKVSFAVSERCLVTDTFDCSDAKFTKHSTDGLHWPDVPVDSMCKETGKCYVGGPTFWTRKWLAEITTQVATAPGASTYRPVDSIELKHNFLDARYDTNPPAWLDSIRRTGHAADGAIASLPPVTFHANVVDMPNRQTGPGDNRPPFVRLRVAKIFTETGGGISVTYSQPDTTCAPAAAKPDPHANASRCFPVHWAPDGEDEPKTKEWFNKYVVVKVSEEDFVGGAPPVVTEYRYLDGAAWAKDDSEFTKPAERTWNVWRGYARVQAVKGKTDGDHGTVAGLTEHRFFRGMHGDPLPSGTRTVTVRDSTGAVIADDLPPYQGMTAEVVTYLADATTPTVNTREVTVPWSSPQPTATQTRPGLPALKAYQTGTAAVRATQVISGGRTRSTEAGFTMDPTYGLPIQQESRGDIAVTGDEHCTVTSYAHNTTANILGAVTQVRTTAGLCTDADTAGPDKIVSDQRTLYDNLPFGAAPTKGSSSSTEVVNASGVGYSRVSATAYDNYGRATRSTDAQNNDTVTAYTPADNSAPTEIAVTNPLTHVTTATLETGRGLTTGTKDANGKVTRTAYDPLGRVTESWSASRTATGSSPNIRIAYAVSADRPTVITGQTLRDNGTYEIAKTFYDGLMRPRQSQREAVGSGRLVSDTHYNPNGGVRRSTAPYLADGEPVDSLYQPTSLTQIRTWTENRYDGMNRGTKTELWYGGSQTPNRTTEIQYGGDYTITIPPPGGTPSRVWNDALGRTVKLELFTDAARTAFTTTTYQFNERGDRVRATDPAGNAWTSTFDARGQLVETNDPDKGRTTWTHDNAGRTISESDARGNTLATTYDALGRTTTLRASDQNGPKLVEWTYDGPGARGKPVSSIRYDNGNTYTTTVTGYDDEYRTLGTTLTIPAAEGALGRSYTTGVTYTPTGRIAETIRPAVGALPSEKIVSRYTADGLPLSTSGQAWYTADTIYSPYGEPLRTQVGAASKRLWATNTYDEHTGQLLTAAIHRETGPHFVAENRYGYDKSNNVTYINQRTLNSSGTVTNDVQCYNYDQLRRLIDAWTSTNHCASGPQTGSGATVGGPDAYWTTYTYDAIGNRSTEKVHDPAGRTGQDTVRTYSYPSTSSGNTHQLTSVASTGPVGAQTNSYTYDAAGNTRTRTGPSGTQTLTWNTEDKLETLTTTGTSEVVKYLYDAEGNLLLRRNQGATTLFLGSDELILDTATGIVAATRYYTMGGGLTAVRTNDGKLSFLGADHHGTNSVNVDGSTQAITFRRTTPFGELRGTPPANWPGQKGFVGGALDIDTDLTNLGARQYDPKLGRFLSPDPLLDLGDPQQWNSYGYANNNPATISDPSGLFGGFSIGGSIGWGKLNPFSKQAVKDAWAWTRDAGRTTAGGALQGVADVFHEGEAMGYALCKVFGGNCGPPPGTQPPNPLVHVPMPSQVIEKTAQKVAVDPNSTGFRVGRFIGYALSSPSPGGGAVGAGVKVTTKTLVKVGSAAGKSGAKGATKPIVNTVERVAAGCNSFPDDVPVLMADGSTKPIQDIEVGDKVTATKPLTGETTSEAVTDTIYTSNDHDYTDLTIQALDGTQGTLTSTQHHPYWNTTTNTWVNATDLNPGDELRQPDGNVVIVVGVRDYAQRTGTHNLSVDGAHTYYVQVAATAVLVHNCPPPLPPFKQGGKTTGGFKVEEGDTPWVISSGEDDPLYATVDDFLKASPDYVGPRGAPSPAASHVEAQLAWLQRQSWDDGVRDTHVYINKPDGPCGNPYGCVQAVPAILYQGQTMYVHYPNATTPMPLHGRATPPS